MLHPACSLEGGLLPRPGEVEAYLKKNAAQKKMAEEEAWSRKDYIENCSDKLKGGLQEFYKSRYAEKNGEKHLMNNWLNEAKRICGGEFFRNLVHSTKGVSNYDKAYAEIVEEVFYNDDAMRKWAMKEVEKSFGELEIPIDNSDTETYRKMMDDTFSKAKEFAFKAELGSKKPAKRNKNWYIDVILHK